MAVLPLRAPADAILAVDCAVAELTEEGNSQRQIAQVLGVNRETVGKDLAGNQPLADADSGDSDGSAAGNQPLDTVTSLAADGQLT